MSEHDASKITPANPYSVPSNVSLTHSTGVELKSGNNLCNIPKATPSGLAGEQRAYTKNARLYERGSERSECVLKTDENLLWPQLDVEEHGLNMCHICPRVGNRGDLFKS